VDIDDRDQVAQQFRVAPEQVERDHLISYLLAFLSEQCVDRIHFVVPGRLLCRISRT
jgi:hypothetical protein